MFEKKIFVFSVTANRRDISMLYVRIKLVARQPSVLSDPVIFITDVIIHIHLIMNNDGSSSITREIVHFLCKFGPGLHMAGILFWPGLVRFMTILLDPGASDSAQPAALPVVADKLI